MTRYRVTRYLGETLVKRYYGGKDGLFVDRDVAQWIAQRACEKHPECIVVVEPVHEKEQQWTKTPTS